MRMALQQHKLVSAGITMASAFLPACSPVAVRRFPVQDAIEEVQWKPQALSEAAQDEQAQLVTLAHEGQRLLPEARHLHTTAAETLLQLRLHTLY